MVLRPRSAPSSSPGRAPLPARTARPAKIERQYRHCGQSRLRGSPEGRGARRGRRGWSESAGDRSGDGPASTGGDPARSQRYLPNEYFDSADGAFTQTAGSCGSARCTLQKRSATSSPQSPGGGRRKADRSPSTRPWLAIRRLRLPSFSHSATGCWCRSASTVRTTAYGAGVGTCWLRKLQRRQPQMLAAARTDCCETPGLC